MTDEETGFLDLTPKVWQDKIIYVGVVLRCGKDVGRSVVSIES